MNSCLMTSKHLFFALAVYMLMPAVSADWNPDITINRPQLSLQLKARTTLQMQAFYEARGFPVDKLKEIATVCFFTIGIENRINDTLWVDMSRWQAHDQQGRELQIRNRSQWKRRWKELGLPLPNSSTFSWTVMPDARDLYPQEKIGSNVTVIRNASPMGLVTITARFPVGKDKQGEEMTVKLEKLKCPE